MLVRYMLLACPFVRLSVSPSVTRQYCTETAKRKIMQTTPYDRPGTLVFWRKNLGEIPTGLSPTGAHKKGGVGADLQFSTNISLYLKNGTR